MPFDRDRMKRASAFLASKGIYIGTSSWNYEGWMNQLYTKSRYAKQGKDAGQGMFALGFEQAPEKIDAELFEANCLAEYAEVFKTVGVDSTYYKFPLAEKLRAMADQ